MKVVVSDPQPPIVFEVPCPISRQCSIPQSNLRAMADRQFHLLAMANHLFHLPGSGQPPVPPPSSGSTPVPPPVTDPLSHFQSNGQPPVPPPRNSQPPIPPPASGQPPVSPPSNWSTTSPTSRQWSTSGSHLQAMVNPHSYLLAVVDPSVLPPSSGQPPYSTSALKSADLRSYLRAIAHLRSHRRVEPLANHPSHLLVVEPNAPVPPSANVQTPRSPPPVDLLMISKLVFVFAKASKLQAIFNVDNSISGSISDIRCGKKLPNGFKCSEKM
nr:basic proline-rich protein-like [Ipomoea batatas]